MPEGHTLHRLAQALDGAFAGTTPDLSSPQGRFSEGAALLDGRAVVEASAWGTHLFVEFAGEQWLGVHLGLIGKFSVEPYDRYAGVPPVRGQVRLRLLTSEHVADLRGAIICAVLTPGEVDAVVARLGPDPLRAEQDPDRAWTRLSRSGRSVAELLMDQSILAGVGNVYRCEVLFRHRVDPFRPGKEIRKQTWELIWGDLVRLMPLGVAFNQIITMQDQVEQATARVAEGRVPSMTSVHTDSARRPEPVDRDVDPADRAEEAADGLDLPRMPPRPARMRRRYYVYRRQGESCVVCGSTVRTRVVAGRNLFGCGRCQRRR